jgi:hypothetical protein
VFIAEFSMKSKIRINDYNDFRKYNVRRVVFDTSLLVEGCRIDERNVEGRSSRDMNTNVALLLACFLYTGCARVQGQGCGPTSAVVSLQ